METSPPPRIDKHSHLATVLFHAMGCDAPWYSEPPQPVPQSETRYYQEELVRLLSSSSRDLVLASFVFAMCRRHLMLSREAQLLIAEHRDIACTDCLPASSPNVVESFAVWRDIEVGLKLRQTNCDAAQRLALLKRNKNTWLRELPASDSEYLQGTAGFGSSRASPIARRGPANNTATLAPPLDPMEGAAATPPQPFSVDIHSKANCYSRRQLLMVEYQTMRDDIADAEAVFQGCVDSQRLLHFNERRVALMQAHGVHAAEADMRRAERRESDRSRIDGLQHEHDAAARGVHQIAALLWHNLRERVACSSLPQATLWRAVAGLDEATFRTFFYASLACQWSTVHEQLAGHQVLPPHRCAVDAARSNADGQVNGRDNEEMACVAAAAGHLLANAANGGAAATPRLEFFHNDARRAFHLSCATRGVPHLVVLTSSKYKCGNVHGELDLAVVDLVANRLLLVVEAKSSAGDLVKARDQKARLFSVISALTPQQLRVRDGAPVMAPSTPDRSLTVGCVSDKKAGAAAASSPTTPASAPTPTFTCAGSVVEFHIVPACTTTPPQPPTIAVTTSGGHHPSKSEPMDPSSAVDPKKRPRQAHQPHPRTLQASVVRLDGDAVCALPLVGGSLSCCFAYCTSLGGNTTAHKSPYYSGIAHIVQREYSKALSAALLPIDDHRHDGRSEADGDATFQRLRTLVHDALATEAATQQLVQRLPVRRMTENIRRAWLSEVGKPTSSNLRPPTTLWRELEETGFHDLILV